MSAIKFLLKCLIGCSFFFTIAFAQNTLTYTYDALGRVTFVKDNVNGNRDFDYDKAGNRIQVAVGNASDAVNDPPPPPLPPTNAKSVPGMGSSYINSWDVSAGATYYLLLINGNYITVNGTSYQSSGYRGVNVSACNALNLCSNPTVLSAQ